MNIWEVQGKFSEQLITMTSQVLENNFNCSYYIADHKGIGSRLFYFCEDTKEFKTLNTLFIGIAFQLSKVHVIPHFYF